MTRVLAAVVLLVCAAALRAPRRMPSPPAAASSRSRSPRRRPGARFALVDRRGRQVAAQRAGSLGAILFRDVKPGSGYRVARWPAARPRPRSPVLPNRSAPPSTKVYDQTIPDGGYGYLTTRDGTKLAIDVRLPGPTTRARIPPSSSTRATATPVPAGAESGISVIGTLLGYAVVDVNMRGTGCSGGAFDYFEPNQALDGYDVIETVARQPLGACTTRSG